eukprot:6521413-Prymnesium_polylepis.1
MIVPRRAPPVDAHPSLGPLARTLNLAPRSHHDDAINPAWRPRSQRHNHAHNTARRAPPLTC